MFKGLFGFLNREPKEEMKPDKIVVGLGNPGNQYKGTRHNAGFGTLTELARRHAAGKPQKRFQGETFDVKIGGTNVLLLCPLTFMNLSGKSVAAALAFYKLAPENLLVVCDDVDLPVGKIRVRNSGGSGGQKGLKDILQKTGTEDLARVRIGVGRPPERMETADYVLSAFRPEEKADIESAFRRAADAVECWIERGVSETMNRFNG